MYNLSSYSPLYSSISIFSHYLSYLQALLFLRVAIPLPSLYSLAQPAAISGLSRCSYDVLSPIFPSAFVYSAGNSLPTARAGVLLSSAPAISLITLSTYIKRLWTLWPGPAPPGRCHNTHRLILASRDSRASSSYQPSGRIEAIILMELSVLRLETQFSTTSLRYFFQPVVSVARSAWKIFPLECFLNNFIFFRCFTSPCWFFPQRLGRVSFPPANGE